MSCMSALIVAEHELWTVVVSMCHAGAWHAAYIGYHSERFGGAPVLVACMGEGCNSCVPVVAQEVTYFFFFTGSLDTRTDRHGQYDECRLREVCSLVLEDVADRDK